jgi:transposase-like protein
MDKRRQHSAEFEARVALEAAQGSKTVRAIAQEHEVHPVQVRQWKKEPIERLPEVFGRKPGPKTGIEAYVHRYNTWWPRQAFGGITPQMTCEGKLANIA